MSNLPDVIIFDILSRLPVKSLFRFRCVCKPWCKLFNDPEFVKFHLNRVIEKNNFHLMVKGGQKTYSVHYDASSTYTDDDEPVVEVDYPFKSPEYGFKILGGSCNGLFCISVGYNNGFYIWNPSTKEYKEIPTPPYKFPSCFGINHGAIAYGFGYNCEIDDYKLVRVVGFDSCGYDIQVYTLRSNSWKCIPNIPYNLAHREPPGVLVNGSLHWIATPYVRYQSYKLLVSFSIGDERFEEVPQPKYFDDNLLKNVGVLRGCLCLIGNLYMVHAEVWVMQEYGVRESWTKVFTIPQQPPVTRSLYVRPITSFKNGEILLEQYIRAPVLYDPKHERVRVPNISGIPKCFDIEIYMETLVSLNSGTYVGQEQIRGSKRKHEEEKMKVG